LTVPIGIASWGTYVPTQIETAAQIAAVTGIPEEVVATKMGVRQKHVAGPEDHCSQMAARAAQQALTRAGLSAEDVDLILYHGSEYKDYRLERGHQSATHPGRQPRRCL